MGCSPAGIEFFADTKALGNVEEDVEVCTRESGRRDDTIDFADASLGVRVGTLLFAPDGGGEDKVCELAGGRWMKAILYDEEIYALERLLEKRIVRKRDRRVGGNEPERFDLAADSASMMSG